MSRTVAEWVGKNDNAAVPQRVRARVFTSAGGYCANCLRRLWPGDKWTCDHRIALINGGLNRESNLQVLCEWCDKKKTASDVATKSKSYRVRAKHVGLRCKRRSFLTNKDSLFKKKLNGEVVRR